MGPPPWTRLTDGRLSIVGPNGTRHAWRPPRLTTGERLAFSRMNRQRWAGVLAILAAACWLPSLILTLRRNTGISYAGSAYRYHGRHRRPR